jgi:protoheme IX farnesyltransferase
MVGLLIAPHQVDFKSSIISLLAVAIGSGAAGVLNMWYESDLDALMSRTCLRPIPTGKIKKKQALYFGIILSFISITMLYHSANLISAILLASTIAFYFFIYTIWLKRKTSQNIVIGGAAGALPPVIGWTISTGSITIEPIILFLIIFIWTPSHFWALSLYKSNDYKKAKIPMLPVIAGEKTTKINILIYSLLMLPIVIAPYIFNLASLFYLTTALLMTLYYNYLCFELFQERIKKISNKIARKVFLYSIFYLFLIYLILLIDNAKNF